jgi:hypothetical protein
MATKANLVIDQGTTFSTTITMMDDNGNLIDLTGYSANSQIRKHYTSTTAVNFSAEINVSTAEITLSLTNIQTANLTAGRYVYDVEVSDTYSNTVSRVVEGIVTITPNVTR